MGICSLEMLLSDFVCNEMDKQQKNEEGFIIDQGSIDEYLESKGDKANAITVYELYNYLVKEGFGEACGYLVSFHDGIIECEGEYTGR